VNEGGRRFQNDIGPSRDTPNKESKPKQKPNQREEACFARVRLAWFRTPVEDTDEEAGCWRRRVAGEVPEEDWGVEYSEVDVGMRVTEAAAADEEMGAIPALKGLGAALAAGFLAMNGLPSSCESSSDSSSSSSSSTSSSSSSSSSS